MRRSGTAKEKPSTSDLRAAGWLTLKELVKTLWDKGEGVFLGRSGLSTIRYYQQQGLIPAPQRGKGPEGQPNVAYYPPEVVEKIVALRQRKVGEKTANEIEDEAAISRARLVYQSYFDGLSEDQQASLSKAAILRDLRSRGLDVQDDDLTVRKINVSNAPGYAWIGDLHRNIPGFSGTQTGPLDPDAIFLEIVERVPPEKIRTGSSKYLTAHLSPSDKAEWQKKEREFLRWSNPTVGMTYQLLEAFKAIKTAFLSGDLEGAYRYTHSGALLAEVYREALAREFRDTPHPRARLRKGRAKR